jgi:hypothetical protein
LALLLLAGCARTSTQAHSITGPAAAALQTAQAQAGPACSRAEPDTGFAAPVTAAFAAAALTRADVTPDPWTTLPPDDAIYACFARTDGKAVGTFRDTAGVSTPMPAASFRGCNPATTATTGAGGTFAPIHCSLVASTPPSTSKSPAIIVLAVLVVIGAGVWIWVVRRRRRRPVSL